MVAESVQEMDSVPEEKPKKSTPGKKKTDPEELSKQISSVEEERKETERSSEAAIEQYRQPPLSLLKKGSGHKGDSDAHLRATALKLEQTLQNFGVKVHVTNASCGPSVTRYEIDVYKRQGSWLYL